jgi:hypothetical protein
MEKLSKNLSTQSSTNDELLPVDDFCGKPVPTSLAWLKGKGSPIKGISEVPIPSHSEKAIVDVMAQLKQKLNEHKKVKSARERSLDAFVEVVKSGVEEFTQSEFVNLEIDLMDLFNKHKKKHYAKYDKIMTSKEVIEIDEPLPEIKLSTKRALSRCAPTVTVNENNNNVGTHNVTVMETKVSPYDKRITGIFSLIKPPMSQIPPSTLVQQQEAPPQQQACQEQLSPQPQQPAPQQQDETVEKEDMSNATELIDNADEIINNSIVNLEANTEYIDPQGFLNDFNKLQN